MKTLPAEAPLASEVPQEVRAIHVVPTPTHHQVMLVMRNGAMGERHTLRVVGMSAFALRYGPRPDSSGWA